MTRPNGRPLTANTEQLKLVAEEMLLRLNKAEAAAMGVEIPENAANKEIEQLTEKKYNKIKSEYQESFKEAYGNKNIETLADDYINSQKQNTAYVQTALDVAYRICEKVTALKELNVALLKGGEGKRMVSPSLSFSPEDEEYLKKMLDRGIKIESYVAPDDKKVSVEKYF